MSSTFEEVFENTFVISVASRDRSTFTLRHLAELGIHAQVFQGIDGYLFPDDTIDDYPLLAQPNEDASYGRKSVKGALGCVLSHLQVQQLGAEYGTVTIFEDDALLAPNFVEYVSKALEQVPDDWDSIHYSAKSIGATNKVNDYWMTSEEHRCLVAYSVRMRGQQTFLAAFNSNPTWSDMLTDNPLFADINKYCLTPSMAVQQWVKSSITSAVYLAASLRPTSWLADLTKQEYRQYVIQHSDPQYWPKNFTPT